MKDSANESDSAAKLRQRAEQLFSPKSVSIQSESDALRLAHELEVHRIELEMQKEELEIEKARAEEIAKQNSELYESAPSGYFSLSRNGTIIKLNLKGAEMLGIERSSFIDTQFCLYISDNSEAVFNEFLVKIFTSKINQYCEVQLEIINNSLKYIYLSGIINANKEECLITAVDISDRKRVEEELQKSEEVFRLLMKNMNIGVQLNEIILNENSIPVDFRIIDGNVNLKDFTGYSIDEAKGKTIKQINPDADNVMIQRYGAVALTGEAFTLEYYSRTFNKQFRVNSYSPKKGQFACLFEDIEEKTRFEQKIRINERRLRNANAIAGVGNWELDLHTKQVWASEASFKIYGIESTGEFIS